MRPILSLVIVGAGAASFAVASAQPRDTVALLAAETEAMKAFSMLDGAWRGPATVIQPDGTRLDFIQTERIGPLLGGSIRVIEGRGYDDNGAVRFNAFAIVSFDPASKSYSLHSHALGHVGDFAFVPTGDGYRWEIPLGPATIRYVATVKDGELHEVGERVVAGGAPMRIFEMRLKRIGDVDWPAAGAIAPK
ncbi:MAG: DUF1579 domain-containing protein [Caldimonas sp.]